MTMEVEEVQVKMEDEAKAGGDTSEKVLVDKELLNILFSILSDPTGNYNEKYKRFYKINKKQKVEYFYVSCKDDWHHSLWWPIVKVADLELAKRDDLLCPELSNLSFDEIKKLGETSAPGLYFKGKKVWDL